MLLFFFYSGWRGALQMFVESVFLNHLINFQTSPFPKRLVITHTKTIYLCQNLRNIHIGLFFLNLYSYQMF